MRVLEYNLTMKKYILILGFILMQQFLFAQDIIVSGKVIDNNKEEGVPFANIGIAGEAVGTVTNLRGEYELHIPPALQNGSIVVSCIGYDNQEYVISDISNPQSFNIELVPRTYVLSEFEVRPKELTAREIVEIAIRRIPNNYISKPYAMDGFYREFFEENKEYVAFAEAAVKIYDPAGYGAIKPKPKELITLEQIRISDIKNQGDYVLYIDINYALRGNVVRNRDFWKRFSKKNRFDVVDVRVDSLTYYDNDLVYSISYKMDSERSGNYEGKLFIRTKDYAVLRVELNAINLLKGRIVNGAPHKSRSIMTYREHDNKLYLNYVNASHEVIYDFREQRYYLNFFSELQISNIQTKNINKDFVYKRAEEKSIFYLPRYRTYDPDFWLDYNLFFDSPDNAQIIADLENKRPLDTQFRANGKLKIDKILRKPTELKKSKYEPGASN